MSSSVGKQIAKGTVWTVFMRLSMRFLGIISLLILARLLVPDDYGLVAKAVLIGGFLELITQFGFSAALIRNQNATQQDYDTVWTLSVIRAVSLAILLVLGASSIAAYFDEPKIEALIYCYALANALIGFNNVGIVDFQKEMRFDKDFKFNILKKLSSFVTTISIAFIWQSYWAFPIGVLVGNIVALIASFVMSSYRPKYSLASSKSIFNFSKWMFLYGAMGALSEKLDSFLLSKAGTDAELGLYTIAKEISSMPTLELAMPVARAALPGLSKLNKDITVFRAMYNNILVSVLFLAVPAAIGISVLSTEIALVALGEAWLGTAPFIEILAFYGLLQVFGSCSVSALIAYDRADLLGKISIVTVTLKLIILPTGIYFGGISGLVLGVLLAEIIRVVILLTIQSRINVLYVTDLLKDLWRMMLSAFIMYLCLIMFLDNFTHTSVLVNLLGAIIIGLAVFSLSTILICTLLKSNSGPEAKLYSLIKSKLSIK